MLKKMCCSKGHINAVVAYLNYVFKNLTLYNNDKLWNHKFSYGLIYVGYQLFLNINGGVISWICFYEK